MEQKVMAIISKCLHKKINEININTRLVEDLGADSLDIVELLMAFEDEFGLTVADEDAVKFKTVKDIVDYIINATK